MIDTTKLTKERLGQGVDWMDDMSRADLAAVHELLLAGAGLEKDDLEALALEVSDGMTDSTLRAMEIAKTPVVVRSALAVAFQYGALAMLKTLSDLDSQDGER